MQIKTTMNDYLMLVRWLSSKSQQITNAWKKKKTNAWKDVEKRKSPYAVDGNVNWYNHYGKQYGGSLKNEK